MTRCVLVALEDRTDAIWVAEGLDAITDAEIDAIIADELEPRLRDGDFTGAAIAAVEALGAANDAGRGARTHAPDGAGAGAGRRRAKARPAEARSASCCPCCSSG